MKVFRRFYRNWNDERLNPNRHFSKDFKDFINKRDALVLFSTAFCWSRTCEGHGYWKKINEEYLQFIKT